MELSNIKKNYILSLIIIYKQVNKAIKDPENQLKGLNEKLGGESQF